MIARRMLLGCAAGLALPKALLAQTAPATIRERQDIKLFSQEPAKVKALRAGVAKMKSYSTIDPDDPRGWNYWSSIHGRRSPAPAGLERIYSQCDHTYQGYVAQHFLSWHRAYLLFFEATLQAAAGAAGETTAFQLPYWNWYADGDLPTIFTTGDAQSNPLWHERVSTSLDPQSLDTAFFDKKGLLPATFSQWGQSFSVPLEMNPHGSVHGVIGGDMGSIQTSARDPIFWLHHANIDRLWTAWIQRGAGRANPAPTSAWGKTAFTFDAGAKLTKTAAGVSESQTQLNYRYDSYAIGPAAAPVAAGGQRSVRTVPGFPVVEAAVAATPGQPASQAVSRAPRIVLRDDIVAVELGLTAGTQQRLTTFAARPASSTSSVWLQIEDLVVSQNAQRGGFSYSIAAALPDKPDKAVVLAEINTFTLPLYRPGRAEGHAHHAQTDGPLTIKLDLSQALAALGVRNAAMLNKGLLILFRPAQSLGQTAVADPLTVGGVVISTTPQ